MAFSDVDDEFDDIIPKKQRKPSKPRGMLLAMQILISAKPADEPKRAKHREPTPELTEESSIDSIQEVDADTSSTSLDESFIQESAPKKQRARPSKAEPQPKVKATPQQKGVKGRKPKMAIVPETQVEVSVIEEEEEDEVHEIETAPRRRQGSVLPASMAKKAYEVCATIEVCLMVATREEGCCKRIANSRREELCVVQRNDRKKVQMYDSTRMK